jgi:hypothetical protein
MRLADSIAAERTADGVHVQDTLDVRAAGGFLLST